MGSMVVYIHRGMEGGERIGCASDTMSVMSEQANDERQRGGHVVSYNLSKKPLSSETKKPSCSKGDTLPDPL